MFYLEALPPEILLEVLIKLNITDLLNLCKTSKKIAAVTERYFYILKYYLIKQEQEFTVDFITNHAYRTSTFIHSINMHMKLHCHNHKRPMYIPTKVEPVGMNIRVTFELLFKNVHKLTYKNLASFLKQSNKQKKKWKKYIKSFGSHKFYEGGLKLLFWMPVS